MAKATWIKQNSTWRKVKNVWVKIDGAWKQNIIPKGKIAGIWKEFIEYANYIVKDGQTSYDFSIYNTPGWNSRIVFKEDHILHEVTREGDINGVIRAWTNIPIDVTNYSTLSIEWEQENNISDNYFFVTTTTSVPFSDIASSRIRGRFSRRISRLDISDLSGVFYIGWYVNNFIREPLSKLKIYNYWLE